MYFNPTATLFRITITIKKSHNIPYNLARSLLNIVLGTHLLMLK